MFANLSLSCHYLNSLSPSSSTNQGSEETRLRHQHISTLVVSLADFVRMADRKIIANTLSQLKLELDFDSTAISQLQVVLFGFQDAVSTKRRGATDSPVFLLPISCQKAFFLYFSNHVTKSYFEALLLS